MKPSVKSRPALYVSIALLVVAIFAVDVGTDLGMSIWVLYFVPLVLCLFTARPTAPVVVSVCCAALIIAGYFASPTPPAAALYRISQINRSLGCLALIALGGMFRQFIVARIRLSLQDWISRGQSELSARLQGERDIEELARRLLSFLAEYLDAQVGSMYVQGGGGMFVRRAGHGLTTLGEGAEVVASGQTLVGQVAADGRLVTVHDVPKGYLEVRSGIGAADPRLLMLVPVRADGIVNGVIELGFFTPPPAVSRELLTAIAESVGIAIRSAQYRHRQAELLEETQRQAEELQIQQEGLRAANEELEQQSRSLEESQNQLEETNAQLEEQARMLETQKDQVSATRDVLQRRAAEIEQASRYKSEFLANMSHELRTPLNSALILAKLLVDNTQGNLTPEQVQYAANIYTAGNDLLSLINDILDLSKIEAGKVDLAFEPVSLGQLFGAVEQRFQPLAREKNLAYTVSVDSRCPATVETDGLRLQQVLTNLLSNAIKFTERGSITLRADPGPNEDVLISVEDTGVGIPADQHELIFEAFHQADATTNRKYGGTGLGLSISRELVELLGGELRLESVPGRGSKFTVVLPVRAHGIGHRRVVRRQPERRPPRADGSARPAPVEDDRNSLTQPSRLVAIVEDDAVFASLLRELAHELQFQCIIARNAEEGLELVREFKPTAIILDIGLPDHSGLTVLELLKRDASARHIPIHVVSAHDYQRVAREMGVLGYALKPVKRDELVDAFRRIERQISRKARAVLVVEDDPIQREAITKLLASDGVTITPVSTAADAWAKLDSETFDCVVLDLMLSGTSAFELLERLARSGKPAVPPIIVQTASALTLEEEQQLRQYARSIIVKGARSPERLLEEVTLFLHKVETDLPDDKRAMLRAALDREAVFTGRRILIVEDDIRNIFALTSALESKGASIEIARNGKEALRQLELGPAVDLVLMDVMMPEMDGITAVREIRKQPQWAGLPIIVLTAKAMPDDRQLCLEAGANDYIAKPIDLEKLVSLVRVWMPR